MNYPSKDIVITENYIEWFIDDLESTEFPVEVLEWEGKIETGGY